MITGAGKHAAVENTRRTPCSDAALDEGDTA
jgi:hypothetical protein